MLGFITLILGMKVKWPFTWRRDRGNLDAMRLLIEAGADVNANASLGKPLHEAAEKGNMDAMRLLIEAGADVNAKDEMGTVLHAVAERGSVDAMRLLIEAGADVNARVHYTHPRDEVKWPFTWRRTAAIWMRCGY